MGSDPDRVQDVCSAARTVWDLILIGLLASVCQLCSGDSMGFDPDRIMHACLLQFADSAAWTVWGLVLIGYCMLACYNLPALQRGQYQV